MTEKHSSSGPYEFTKHDLAPGTLEVGVDAALGHYYEWRTANTTLIANHVSQHTERLEAMSADQRISARLRRQVDPAEKKRFHEKQLTHDIGYFCLYNAAELPDEETTEAFRRGIGGRAWDFSRARSSIDIGNQIPVLSGITELKWLDEQLARLQRILPETVIQSGGLGKAARTTTGILALGLYDVIDEPAAAQRDYLASIIPAGYAYGAMYPIIDDALQDSNIIPRRDKERYHEVILRALRSGAPIDSSEMPDHPLAEELENIYNILLNSIPFAQNRHFYHAGESMYLAQHRDAQLTAENVAGGGLRAMYRDAFIKSTMTRVVANLIARRDLGDDYYARAMNINFINQFTDDLQDRHEDRRAGRITPFTAPVEARNTNPLYDLFGYSAYIVHQVFDGEPRVLDVLAHSCARRLVGHLHADADGGEGLIREYGGTPEIAHFIHTVAGLSGRVVRGLQYADMKLEKAVNDISQKRTATDTDPRVFVSDERDYINSVVQQGASAEERPIDDVARYALEAGGKRLRPALALMLAESLNISRQSIGPLLKAVEWFHTSSLIFDDLPAQDDAQLRRGRPTTHMAFGEARAQLAGIAMISGGFGALSALAKHYPAERVTKLVDYFGNVLGPEGLCLGQDMDLRMAKGESYTSTNIIKMYSLKTSTLIEASLVPIMLLEGRSDEEVELVKNYAHHAGIVYQLRDDILDATSESDVLGKDANNDISKVNIVRVSSIEEARRLMEQHLDAARQYCARLPFNTNLLTGVVTYFATRKA